MQVEEALSRVSLFAALPPAMLRTLAEVGHSVHLGMGEVVCREGEIDRQTYVVLAGALRVFKLGPDGGEVAVAHLGEGDFFGELAMFDGKPRSATVQALTAVSLFAIDGAAFTELLSSAHSSDLMGRVFAALVSRVRETTQRVLHTELERRTRESQMEAERHRMIAEMLAGVAHELNTPLGVANTAASIIESRLAEPEVAGALEGDWAAREAHEDMADAAGLIRRNVARAHHLVETLKRVSVDHFVEDVESVDLSALVVDVIDLFRLHARQTGLAVTVDDQLPEAGRTWVGCPGRLTQALTNLLFNAERHAYPEGGGTVTLRAAAVEGGFELSVQDAGVGIPADRLGRIFTPFFTTARGQGGSGLGLAIVRSAVRDGLGGTVTVDSAVGQGTRFTIWVPAVVEVAR